MASPTEGSRVPCSSSQGQARLFPFSSLPRAAGCRVEAGHRMPLGAHFPSERKSIAQEKPTPEQGSRKRQPQGVSSQPIASVARTTAWGSLPHSARLGGYCLPLPVLQ